VKHAELERHRHFSLSSPADTLGSITQRCQSRNTFIRASTVDTAGEVEHLN
jgi:hypothetical protein